MSEEATERERALAGRAADKTKRIFCASLVCPEVMCGALVCGVLTDIPPPQTEKAETRTA